MQRAGGGFSGGIIVVGLDSDEPVIDRRTIVHFVYRIDDIGDAGCFDRSGGVRVEDGRTGKVEGRDNVNKLNIYPYRDRT